jgi:flagellar protein FlaG
MKTTPTAEVITAQVHVIDRLNRKGAVSGKEIRQPATTTVDTTPAKVDPKEVKRAALEINQALSSLNDHLQFSVDNTTNTTVVKLIDGNTGETLRQIPAEEILRLRAYYRDHQGLLVNTAV